MTNPSLREVVDTLAAFFGERATAICRDVVAPFRAAGAVPADERDCIGDRQAAALLIGAATSHLSCDALAMARAFGLMKPVQAAELDNLQTMRVLRQSATAGDCPFVSVVGTEIRLAAISRSEERPNTRIDMIRFYAGPAGYSAIVSIKAAGLPIAVGFASSATAWASSASVRASIDGAVFDRLAAIFGPGEVEPLPAGLLAQCAARAEMRARAA